MDKQQFLAEYQDVFKEPGKDVFSFHQAGLM